MSSPRPRTRLIGDGDRAVDAGIACRAASDFCGGALSRGPGALCPQCIYICPDGELSLFALVWLPGQWTPVHDHGSWGVVGVVEGLLEERAYMSADGEIFGDAGIRLRRGGVVLLNPGAVTTFVPNPDHIHMTGVAAERGRCVSLHLYGRNMDLSCLRRGGGTRKLINVPHYQSR